jgi:hypothetical protein
MTVSNYAADHIAEDPVPPSPRSEPVIIQDIAFDPDRSRLMKQLRVKEESRHAEVLDALLAEAAPIARPKAMYRVSFIEARDEDSIVVEGITFESRVLRVNLEGTNRIFPFAVTAGRELHDWTNSKDDLLVKYYADVISESALRVASRVLKSHLRERFALPKSSTMSPGSLADWPIQEQRPLFALLGDPEEAVGIALTPSMLMIPSKSVSGFYFATEKSFESCQLCSRDRCPSRRAAYDPGLYERRYRSTTDA